MNLDTNIVGIVLGAAVMLFSGLGFLRQISLRREVKDDRDNAASVDGPSGIMGDFFVNANGIHILKMLVVMVGGLFILVSSVDSIGWGLEVRLMVTPLVLIAVAFFSVLLGELESGARGRVREHYRTLWAQYKEEQAHEKELARDEARDERARGRDEVRDEQALERDHTRDQKALDRDEVRDEKARNRDEARNQQALDREQRAKARLTDEENQ